MRPRGPSVHYGARARRLLNEGVNPLDPLKSVDEGPSVSRAGVKGSVQHSHHEQMLDKMSAQLGQLHADARDMGRILDLQRHPSHGPGPTDISPSEEDAILKRLNGRYGRELTGQTRANDATTNDSDNTLDATASGDASPNDDETSNPFEVAWIVVLVLGFIAWRFVV
jgi:hypothetical protein